MKKSNGELIPINYEADPMGFIHIINAYEENDHIFVDAPFKSTAIDYRYQNVKSANLFIRNSAQFYARK